MADPIAGGTAGSQEEGEGVVHSVGVPSDSAVYIQEDMGHDSHDGDDDTNIVGSGPPTTENNRALGLPSLNDDDSDLRTINLIQTRSLNDHTYGGMSGSNDSSRLSHHFNQGKSFTDPLSHGEEPAGGPNPEQPRNHGSVELYKHCSWEVILWCDEESSEWRLPLHSIQEVERRFKHVELCKTSENVTLKLHPEFPCIKVGGPR